MLSMETKTQPGSFPNQNRIDPATQGAAATGSTSGAGPDPNANPDWRSQLQQDARQRIVNKIMDTLKRHLPVSVPEGFSELQKIAVRFEEKIYSAATSQPDYLRKIDLKIVSLETEAPRLDPPLEEKLTKCKICGDCVHERRNLASGAGANSNANPDWRSQLPGDARQRIVGKITDTLKRCIPVPAHEDILSELVRFAVRFEEEVYSTAPSQPNYVRQISIKMLSLERKIERLHPPLPDQEEIVRIRGVLYGG